MPPHHHVTPSESLHCMAKASKSPQKDSASSFHNFARTNAFVTESAETSHSETDE